MALWRLPRPDFHRLVDTDFQDTPLTLRPACSPSRLSDPLHRRLRRLRFLHRRSDCYRVERTSSRAGLSPAVNQRLSRRTCNRDFATIDRTPYKRKNSYLRSCSLPLRRRRILAAYRQLFRSGHCTFTPSRTGPKEAVPTADLAGGEYVHLPHGCGYFRRP